MNKAAYILLQQTNARTIQKRWERLLFWFSFTMAFPSLLLFDQNLSVFLFLAMLFFMLRYKKGAVLNLRKPLQWAAVFFGAGAIASVASIPPEAPSDALDRAMAVLPNYLYWCLLIIFLVTNRRFLNLKLIYKAAFWGLVVTLVYYLFLQHSLRVFPIFNRQTPNNFAFILICYTPMALHFLKEQKGRNWALLFLALLVLILLQDGRRAGMVLVFMGGLAVLYADRINFKRLLAAIVTIPLFLLGLYSAPVESFIFQSSERVHGLIYEPEKIQKEDKSFLIRVAMVKKGMAIFERHPYTGIGLNNFSNITINFDKNFEGAAYVVYKEDLNRKSAHNSYIVLLAEGGIVLLAAFLLIVGTCILYFIFHYFSMDESHKPVFWGLFTMLIHFYFISAIVNVFAWFVIGLACALVYRK